MARSIRCKRLKTSYPCEGSPANCLQPDCQMPQTEEDLSFFDRERDRLAREITSGFEDLLSTTNVVNRKLEEVLGMTKEYETIAALWQTFHELMHRPTTSEDEDGEKLGGLPGTGGHIVTMKSSARGGELS